MRGASTSQPLNGNNLLLAGATVLVIGLALRVPIISVSPILTQIQDTWQLSSISAGLLTTLPVLCFGALALLAPRLEQRFGIERTIMLMLLLTAGGMLVRTFFGTTGLFTGTVILGGAIAVNNVLLPGLIKRDWSHLAGPLMSIYSVSVALGPTLAALLTVPLLTLLAGNVRLTLLAWIAFPLAAALLFQALRRRMPAAAIGRPHWPGPATGNLLREPLAWQVSAFLGIQSLLFYAVSAWLPTLLGQVGLTPVAAGFGFSLFNLVSIAGSLTAPLLAARLKRQSGLAVTAAGLWTVGLGGLLLAPGGIYFWVVIAGLGSGGAFSLALTLLVLRSATAGDAARLSGMAQATGYLLAAAGPFLLGWLLELTGQPTVALLFLLALVPLLGVAGFLAGRPLTVLSRTNVTAEPD